MIGDRMSAKKPMTPSELEVAITYIHTHLTDYPPESKEYAAMADQLVKLYALKTEPSRSAWLPSTDILITVAGNLIGILAIVGYERDNALTSKALGFIGKARS